MNGLITSPAFNENKLRAVMADMSSLKTEITIISSRQRYEISGILTPEQKIKFNAKLILKMKKYSERHSGNTESNAGK